MRGLLSVEINRWDYAFSHARLQNRNDKEKVENGIYDKTGKNSLNLDK
jgi:hypothetical protein